MRTFILKIAHLQSRRKEQDDKTKPLKTELAALLPEISRRGNG
jgi:hypothetical protein